MSPTTDPVIVTVRVSIALEVDGEAIGESRSFTATMRDDEDPNPAAVNPRSPHRRSPMSEPTTKAGRALLEGQAFMGWSDRLRETILAIESEARSDATAPRDAAPLTTIVEELRLIRAGFDHWEHDDERGHMEGDPEIVVLGRKHIPFLDQAIALLSAAPPDPAPPSANEVPITAKLAEWPSAEDEAAVDALAWSLTHVFRVDTPYDREDARRVLAALSGVTELHTDPENVTPKQSDATSVNAVERP